MKNGDKFECDLKEVLKGLSNIFMRIFGSMNGQNGKNSNGGGNDFGIGITSNGLQIPGMDTQ